MRLRVVKRYGSRLKRIGCVMGVLRVMMGLWMGHVRVGMDCVMRVT